MGFDNRSDNGQSHSHALGLHREKWLKHHFGFTSWNAGAGVCEVINAHCSDGNPAFDTRTGRHRVHGIHNEIDGNLLKLKVTVMPTSSTLYNQRTRYLACQTVPSLDTVVVPQRLEPWHTSGCTQT
jgi:hypothetical protein